MRYTSKELNDKISAICDGIEEGDDARWPFEPVPDTGKMIWYYGWYWRDYDFDQPQYRLHTDFDGLNAGFCVSNKWGYPGFTCSISQTLAIREALERAVGNPSGENLETAWNMMQSAIPPGFEKVVRQSEWLVPLR